MQGVKGTYSPGQHGTFVNRRPRKVLAGGVVRFEHKRWQSDMLLDHIGREVMVDESSIHGPDYVSVWGCEHRYRPRNGRMATVRVSWPWLANARQVG